MDPVDFGLQSFSTEPKFAIGQRGFLIETPLGNVIWDLITNIDPPMALDIMARGGLRAIVISHPHYYTTYVQWWKFFKCPIYIGSDDQEWLCRKPPPGEDVLRLIEGPAGSQREIIEGVTAIKTGGHFPGSLVLHWEGKLFIADTIVTVPVSGKSWFPFE